MTESMFEGGDSTVSVDLSNVEEASFEVVPVGEYSVVIKSCEFAHSQSKGSPMWKVQLQILDGTYENRVIFDNIVFSDGALPFTKKRLQVIAPELLQGPFQPDLAAPDMVGRQFKVTTKLEKYEGENQTRVKDYKIGSDSFING